MNFEPDRLKVMNERMAAVPFKIVIIGDSCIGKSSLLLKLINDKFYETHNVTIGVDFKAKYLLTQDSAGNEKLAKLKIWDTAGQERFRAIIRTYYAGVHGIILAFDLTATGTFDNLHDWINEIKDSGIDSCPIMLVGNKSDLTDKRQIHQSDINNFVMDYKEIGFDIQYLECSSRTGQNVNLVFTTLANKLMSIDNLPRTESEKTEINFNQNQQTMLADNGNGSCCTIS